MRRPWLLSLAPEALRGKIWYWVYRGKPGHDALFRKARLDYAGNWAMHDLVPTDYISQMIAFTGHFELRLSRWLRDLAQRGGRLVDVGANMGYFTCIWLAANKANIALAFEPEPRNLKLLSGNLRNNSASDRCTVIAKACGSSSGEMLFEEGPEEQTGWGNLVLQGSKRGKLVEVVRLDEVICDEQPVEVLKIDTEGADPMVLKGAEQLLRRQQVRHIVFEMNLPGMRRLGCSQSELLDYLGQMGYVSRCMEGDGAPVSTWIATPAK